MNEDKNKRAKNEWKVAVVRDCWRITAAKAKLHIYSIQFATENKTYYGKSTKYLRRVESTEITNESCISNKIHAMNKLWL